MRFRTRFARLSAFSLMTLVLVPARSTLAMPEVSPAAVPQIAPEVAASVDKLRSERSLSHVRLADGTGRLRVAYGDLGTISRSGASARAVDAIEASDVVAFLGEFGQALSDQDPASSLTLSRETVSQLGSRYDFAQHVGALPVFDSRVTVHVAPSGAVFGVTSTLRPGLDPALGAVAPVLDETEALHRAMDAAGVTADRLRTADLEPAVLGIAPVDSGHVVWRVVVPASEPFGQWAVFVDAVSGEVVGDPKSLVLRAGTAKVFVPNAVVSTGDTNLTDNNNSASAVPESAYSTVTLTGLDSSGLVTGPFCTTDRTSSRVSALGGDFTGLRRNDRGFNEVETYWAIDTAQRYIQNSLGINSAANYQIHVNVHAFPDDNSNYTSSGGTGVLNFGDGGVDDSQDAEIIWHEYGHAILDNQAEISFNGESGAIHEGWGDYVAATMSTTVPGDSRFYPTIGEWDATSYDFHDPPYLRRVDGTKQYPRDIRNEVHDDGEIWSSCLWGIHTDLGRQTADSIIFNGNFLFPSNVTFEDGAAAYVEADRQIFGGSHASAIAAAFAAHGITAAGPSIASVKRNNGKLVVNGNSFVTGSAVIEINGAALGSMKYPKKYRHRGISTRIASTDSRVAGLPAGVAVQITVLNPSTGARSAPFSFTP